MTLLEKTMSKNRSSHGRLVPSACRKVRLVRQECRFVRWQRVQVHDGHLRLHPHAMPKPGQAARVQDARLPCRLEEAEEVFRSLFPEEIREIRATISWCRRRPPGDQGGRKSEWSDPTVAAFNEKGAAAACSGPALT